MDAGKTLIVFLCMHRSGSSLTTGVLHRLGMSLGPFNLLGADENNKFGYFEARPFYKLDMELQEQAVGFPDDVPKSPDVLRRFLETEGRWHPETVLSPELYQQGKELLGQLIDAAPICGFKDPRVTLLWPFWSEVFASCPGLRVIPVVLLRSPHEIAMSIFQRAKGAISYRDALDVTVVHLKRTLAIRESWPGEVPVVRFSPAVFRDELRAAAEACGLPWQDAVFRDLYDEASRHHEAIVVTHPAQRLFERLSGTAGKRPGRTDLAQSEKTAAQREDLLRTRVHRLTQQAESIRQEVESLRTERSQVQAEREQIGRERSQFMDEREQFRQERIQARQEREQACREREEACREREVARQERIHACQERDSLRQDRDSARQEGLQALQERDQIHQQCQQVRQERDQVRGQFAQVRQECDQVRQECDQVRQECDQVQQEMVRTRGECQRVQEAWEEACRQRDQFRQQLELTRQEGEQYREQYTLSCRQLEQSQRQIEESQRQIEQTREECIQFRGLVEQSQQQCEQSRQACAKYRQDIEAMLPREQQLQQELAQLKRCRLLKLRDWVLGVLRRMPLFRSRGFVASRNRVSSPLS